jgi:GT2 family glycosyltransferase
MDAPLLSINIISYNTKKLTLDCLNSIVRSARSSWITINLEEDIEIVIVDNSSNDGSQAAIRAFAACSPIPIRLVENTENVGFGKGHNKAAKESKGELLLLLNTDTILMKDALCVLVKEYLSKNPSTLDKYKNIVKDESHGERVHFLGPKLLNEDLSPQASCGPYYSIPVIFGALFLKGDYFGFTRYSPNKKIQVDWVSGAAFICKKDCFDDLGGFDEGIFMYMEEIDLFFRAHKKGMTVWFTPSAQIVHLGSASSDKKYPTYQVYRGFKYLYRKHHNQLELTMVQSMLRLKAYLVILIGKFMKKPDLIEIYTKALIIAKDQS